MKELIIFKNVLDADIDIFSIVIENFNDDESTEKIICILLDIKCIFRKELLLKITEKKMSNIFHFLMNIVLSQKFISIKDLFLIGIKYNNLEIIQYLINYRIYTKLGDDFIKELINIRVSILDNSSTILIDNLIEREKEKLNINFNLDAEDFLESDFSDFSDF